MARRTNQQLITIPVTSLEISTPQYGNRNATRVSITLKNSSTAGETITLGVGTSAIAGIGLVLKAGETVSFSKDGGYIPSQEQFTAIADVGTAKLSLFEEIEDVV